MTPSQISDMIERLKSYYVVASMGLRFVADPRWQELYDSFGIDRGSTMRLGRRDDTYYECLDIYKAHDQVQGPGYNLDFLGAMLSVMLVWIGDELAREKYFDRSPQLEFLRHLRNGVAHGNTFSLIRGEPRRPAFFGQFRITPELHGHNVLFEYMMAGDLFDLFDDVAIHLRKLPSS